MGQIETIGGQIEFSQISPLLFFQFCSSSAQIYLIEVELSRGGKKKPQA